MSFQHDLLCLLSDVICDKNGIKKINVKSKYS